jgi:hypothetical protein
MPYPKSLRPATTRGRPYRALWPSMAALVVGVGGLTIGVSDASASAAPGGGTIHVELVGTPASSTQSIVITGAFADAGTFSEAEGLSAVTLSRGSFKVNDSKGNAREDAIFGSLAKVVNPINCGITTSYNAPVKLLDGTGAYAGISGTVSVTTREAGVFPKLASGKCNLSENANPIGFVSIAQGSGSVRF